MGRGKECLLSPFSEILSLFADSGMKLLLNVSWADKQCVLSSRITQVMLRYKSYFSAPESDLFTCVKRALSDALVCSHRVRSK